MYICTFCTFETHDVQNVHNYICTYVHMVHSSLWCVQHVKVYICTRVHICTIRTFVRMYRMYVLLHIICTICTFFCWQAARTLAGDGSMLMGRQDAPIMGEFPKKATYFRLFQLRPSTPATSLGSKYLFYSSLSKVSLTVQKRNFEITPFQTFF